MAGFFDSLKGRPFQISWEEYGWHWVALGGRGPLRISLWDQDDQGFFREKLLGFPWRFG